MPAKSSNDLILWFFLAVLIISFILLGWLFRPFLSSIILAAVITGVFNPVYLKFTTKMRETYASLFTCLIIFFILFIPIFIIITEISKEAYDLYLLGKNAVVGNELKKILENYNLHVKINYILENIGIQISIDELINSISDLGKSAGLFLFEHARNIAANAVKIVINFFLMLLIVFYLLIDNKKLSWFIVDLSPLPNTQDRMLIQKFKEMAGAILIGNGLCGIIQGVLGGILFASFNLKSPILWGVVMCFLAFLPIVGIGVVFVPTAIFLMLSGRIGAGLFFIVFYIILSGGIEYFFKPKFVGKRIQMHTLVVFLSIMGGLKMFGILGIIYGPLIATFFLTLTDIYHSNYQITVEASNGQNKDNSE